MLEELHDRPPTRDMVMSLLEDEGMGGFAVLSDFRGPGMDGVHSTLYRRGERASANGGEGASP